MHILLIAEVQYTNGDVTPTELGGGFGLLPDSPVQGTDAAPPPFVDNQPVFSPESNTGGKYCSMWMLCSYRPVRLSVHIDRNAYSPTLGSTSLHVQILQKVINNRTI